VPTAVFYPRPLHLQKRCRLVISVDLLGRSVAAEIGAEALEPI
jgi:hypothetical protein